jgi:DNA-binding transcriptional LysR family regulator
MEWGDLAYLLSVARTRSLSGAARTLGVSTSTVARRLDVLERHLELRLLDRRVDGVRLTTHGAQVVELATAVEDAVARVERSTASMRQDAWPDPIRVTATEFVVAEVLAPALPRLRQRDPTLRVTLVSAGGVVSLANRDADIAIRMARPVGDSLVARRLPAVRLGLFASRGYLRGRAPASLDLTREALLLYDDSFGPIPELRWATEAQLDRAAVLRTGSTRALLRAASAGAGIALLPVAFAAREETLVEIAPPLPIPVRTPWLVVHRDLRRVRPLRVVHDWVSAAFGDALAVPPSRSAATRRTRMEGRA